MARMRQYGWVILMVMAAYAIFVMPRTPLREFGHLPQTHYQYLTAGFLSGQLSLSIQPSAMMLNLDNPYDAVQNQFFRLHDASLYHHKYYLYFGPLPVVAFFMPFKLLTGIYPAPGLALWFFASLGFIFNFLLLIKIKNHYFSRISPTQVNFFGILLGFANNSPYLLCAPRFYEVAVASAYCSLSIALYYLYEIFSEKCKTQDVAIFSLSVALAVAGRPHFALVCLFLISSVAIYLLKYAPKTQLKKLLLTLFLPALCIGITLAFYNYFRFHSPFEFGIKYQVGIRDYRQFTVLSADFYKHIPLQIYYYFIQPFFVHNIHPVPAVLQKFVTNDTIYEITIGVLSTIPLVSFALLTPKIVKINSRNEHPVAKQLMWFNTVVISSALIILAFLCAVSYTAQRYESDFLPYLLIVMVINLWFLQSNTKYPPLLLKIAKPFFIVSGMASIVLGMNVGMLGYNYIFTYQMISDLTQMLFFAILITLLLTYASYRSLAPVSGN